MTVKSLRSVYQIKVTLFDVEPPIWRRILVQGSINLPDFHSVLQYSMGWCDCHLHQFSADGKYYGIPDDEFDEGDTIDESQYKLSDLIGAEGDSILYEYDFGDNWMHHVVLEKVLPYEKGMDLPQCVEGERNCPPEDVGGPPGYENFLEAITDRSHEEHEDFMEWIGGDFDPEEFDVVVTNQILYDHCD